MNIALALQEHREMWFFDKKSVAIWPIYIVAESKSGDTVETEDGRRIRTAAKSHAVFNTWDFARIAQKIERKEFDVEYEELLARNKLRRTQIEPHS